MSIVFVEIILQVIIRYFSNEFQWLLTKKDERPHFNEIVIKKIIASSYDKELGWVRKPNSSGIDKQGDCEKEYSIDERGARSNSKYKLLPALISTYGDSYTFCREVEDNQTWQTFLSEKTQTNVLNFGVGNYGLDQALLRMKREQKNNKSKILIIAVVPETIVRIHSAWKHYSEYGNIFGFKPRYKLTNSNIELVPNPLSSSDLFYNPDSAIDFSKKNDYFYENKFKKDMLTTPMLFSIFKNSGRNVELVTALIKEKISKKYQGEPNKIVLNYNERLVRKMYKNKLATELFFRILSNYKLYAENQGSIPVFMMLPYHHDSSEYLLSGSYSYEEFVRRVREKLNLLVCNPIASLKPDDDLSELYNHDGYGGHLSTKGNSFVSDVLYKFIKDNQIVK